MSQCAACSGAGWQGQAQLLSPRLSQQPPAPLAPSCSPKGSKPRTPLTRESSFPVAMAIADSKQPVVEKVQQLPQGPYRDEERERNCSRRCCRLTSLPRTWAGGHGSSAEPPLPAGSWDWPSAQPQAWHSSRGAPLAQAPSTAPRAWCLPTAISPLWPCHTLLTWFFTGVTKFPFFLQSIESGCGPELRRKFPLVAEQFCGQGKGLW